MIDSRKRYFVNNTIIFSIGNFGSRLISFFLIPLYTNLLTTSQYGTVDLITTISIVIGPILTLNICESVMRFGLDKNSEKDKLTQIGTLIFTFAAFVGLIIIPFARSFNQLSDYAVHLYLYVFSFAGSQLYLCDLRGKELLVKYSIGNILQTLLIAILNVWFLLVCKLEMKGYLMAYIIANIFTAFYAIIVGHGYKAFNLTKIDYSKMNLMIKYSIVLIPNTFMWWIMNASDRIMVTSIIGVAANGIYAISYKIPTLLSTLTSVVNQAWSYSAIREEGAKDEQEFHNRVFKYWISVSMLMGIGLLAFTKPFLRVYIASNYYDAWKYTPFLIIGSVFLSLGTFMSTSYTVHKDSFGFLFSSIIGAIINIILNFLLIPIVGVYGAATATCISYISVFIFRLFHTRKYLRYKIINKEFIIGSTILLILGYLMFIENEFVLLIQIFLCVFSIVFYSNVWIPSVKKLLNRIVDKNNT